MRLLFDLSATQPSKESRYHGGSDYTKFIFFEALRRGQTFDVCYNKTLPLHDEIIMALQNYELKKHSFTNVRELEKIIHNSNYDRFFSGIPYDYYDLKIPETKFIMSVLGLRTIELLDFKGQIPYAKSIIQKIYLLFIHVFLKKHIARNNYKRFKKLLSIKNKHIFTISQHSLYSILNFFPEIGHDEVSLCYAPLNLEYNDTNKKSETQYILLLSGNRWIKNNLRAIKAIDKLISLNHLEDIQTIVLGCPESEFEKQIQNKDYFIFKDYVSNKELEKYYKNASLFIYPTLNEGFGYPPIYCMNYGVPVIASGVSSVPEICGDAALYFNPYSESEIRNRILNVVLNKEVKSELIQRGHKRIESLKVLQKSMIEKMIVTIFQ